MNSMIPHILQSRRHVVRGIDDQRALTRFRQKPQFEPFGQIKSAFGPTEQLDQRKLAALIRFLEVVSGQPAIHHRHDAYDLFDRVTDHSAKCIARMPPASQSSVRSLPSASTKSMPST
ncbi:hypothetical protein P775_22275 [Puniceibacterium antarcticum]|uniref:Uncharacterized protein n=1 Tax=Puniceibacterium antarcticum TaxID=1206336 RepID=A0A2G8R8Y6_9RHOB|nr:hypothetical protein P775_22275 [Puniceibacterium antarcticum]